MLAEKPCAESLVKETPCTGKLAVTNSMADMIHAFQDLSTPFPSFTPPVHLPFFRSHSTVPKLVVRRMLALRDESLLHFFDNASISAADGKLFSITPERRFCTYM